MEAARDYVLLHAGSRSFIYKISMGELERRLDPAVMLRVSRSAFVGLHAIVSMERDGRSIATLNLIDGAQVRVGITYRERVTQALNPV